MSRAVCRNCWTWYSKGETACPNCHVPLTAADTPPGQFSSIPTPAAVAPPPAVVEPNAIAPAPARSTWRGINWLQSAMAGLLLIGLIAAGVLLAGALGPVTSSDGALSVKVPKGWAHGSFPTGSSNAKTVLGLARLEKTNGVESHFIVEDFGQFVPLRTFEEGWQLLVDSGQSPVVGNFGPLTRTTVAGAPALTVDYQGSKFGGQLMFVDYGSKTYLIEMSSDPSEFAKLRDTDYAAILSSWQWH